VCSWQLVKLIEKGPVFRPRKKRRPQAPVEFQLAALLVHIGTEGEGGSNPKLCNFFVIGRGTVDKYKE